MNTIENAIYKTEQKEFNGLHFEINYLDTSSLKSAVVNDRTALIIEGKNKFHVFIGNNSAFNIEGIMKQTLTSWNNQNFLSISNNNFLLLKC